VIEAILDRVLVSNVAFVEHGEPVCIPMLYARIDGKLYIHGSRASRAMRILARGEPACLTVTLPPGARAGTLGVGVQRELRIGDRVRSFPADR
jgi:hypothetical protein